MIYSTVDYNSLKLELMFGFLLPMKDVLGRPPIAGEPMLVACAFSLIALPLTHKNKKILKASTCENLPHFMAI